LNLYCHVLTGIAVALGATADRAAAIPGDDLKLELTVATERRGTLTFLHAKATATNAGQSDLWITSRRSARIWAGGGVPWVFQVRREDGAPENRTVHWLCRISEHLLKPRPYLRLAPGQSVEVVLPAPCARLVEPGRYVVKVKFEDRPGDPKLEPKGPTARGPLESAPKLVDVSP
jgi:hypothetical protein